MKSIPAGVSRSTQAVLCGGGSGCSALSLPPCGADSLDEGNGQVNRNGLFITEGC